MTLHKRLALAVAFLCAFALLPHTEITANSYTGSDTSAKQGFVPPSLHITSPAPFANLSNNKTITIAWESTYPGDVWYSIVVSENGKEFDVEIASKLKTQECTWIPDQRPLVAWLKVKAFRDGYFLGEDVVPVSFLPETAIIVSKAEQKVYYIRTGQLKYAFICSTALPGYDIGEGTYKVYLKAKKHWSKKWRVWMPYSLFFHKGYALHATTVIRRLGQPASHGCVRLHPRDAEKLYSEVTLGTPVLVLPSMQHCTGLATFFTQLKSAIDTTAYKNPE
ncbi:MAG: L,D-transpeptidase [Armatimonadota bacterium]